MGYYIGDSASELFVILSKHGYDDIRELTVYEITEFEKLIVEKGKKLGKNIYFRSDRYTIPDFISEHGFMFEESTKDGFRSIKLRDDITPCNLIWKFHDLPIGLVDDDFEKKALELMNLKPSPTPKVFDTPIIRTYIEELENKIRKEMAKDIHEIDFDNCKRMRKILKDLESIEEICLESDVRRKSKKYVNTNVNKTSEDK